MPNAPISFKIDTEVPPSYFEKLLDFMYKQYLLPQKQRFSYLTREAGKDRVRLSYVVLDGEGKQLVQVKIVGTATLDATITPLEARVPENVITEARQDIVIATQMFEEKARKATWYFAWREGGAIVPEKVKAHEKSFNRLLLETQILLFTVFTVAGMALFIVTAVYYPDWFWMVPLVLMAGQFILVFYSGNLIARTADWVITKDNPVIHFLEYHLPVGALGTLDELKETSPEQLVAIKKEVYEEILAKKGAIDCGEAQKVFAKYNVACQENNLSAKKVNVYELVKKVANKFGYKMPKVVVSNTMIPNAAASGPSPSRGVVLITTGLLVQLEEEEIVSVVGHEFAHLKGRDPLILYGLTNAEFLFRFYVLFQLGIFQFIFSSFLFFFYFWAVMTLIFFIAKFFEARADLVSAIMVGKPKVLAGALEKIGFQRLLFERTPSYRLQEWVGLDSHPPIYFRVERLEKLQEPVRIKHPLIKSIREVFRGLSQSL